MKIPWWGIDDRSWESTEFYKYNFNDLGPVLTNF